MSTGAALPPDGTGGLTWRPLGVADVPAWARLEAAIEEADRPAERYTADDLEDELVKGSWKDPLRDSAVGVDADGELRAAGLVQSRPGDRRTIRARCFGGVHPRWRRQGVGTALLAWQLSRAQEQIAAARAVRPDGDTVPARVLLHADEHLDDRARLATRLGFSAVRYYVDMLRPLSVEGAPAVPDRPLGGGLELRPFSAELDEPVRRAHNEAFAEHWGSEPRSAEDWSVWTTGHRDFRGDWSFVVLDGDDVAGYALCAAYEQDWVAQGYTQGWTNILGVRPGWRGRGIAPALLAASMRAFVASGMQYAGLDVDSENASGALGLYERMGYTAQRRSVAYALDA